MLEDLLVEGQVGRDVVLVTRAALNRHALVVRPGTLREAQREVAPVYVVRCHAGHLTIMGRRAAPFDARCRLIVLVIRVAQRATATHLLLLVPMG